MMRQLKAEVIMKWGRGGVMKKHQETIVFKSNLSEKEPAEPMI